MWKFWASTCVLVGLSACAPGTGYQSNFVDPRFVGVEDEGPFDAPDGTCWGRDETPATVETVTQTTLERPETRDADGKLLEAAIYRSVQIQRIVEARDDIWFETPCLDQITPDFVAALQRALAARGLYDGADTGQVDPATINAVRTYQKGLDLNSGQLSLVAARKLGLIVYSKDQIDQF